MQLKQEIHRSAELLQKTILRMWPWGCCSCSLSVTPEQMGLVYKSFIFYFFFPRVRVLNAFLSTSARLGSFCGS